MNEKEEFKQIKIYGMHRSGTNYLRVILEKNFFVNVLHNEGGWKHGYYYAPQLLGKEVDCIFITKNIFSWLVSMWKYCNFSTMQKSSKNFSDFIKSEFILYSEPYDNYIDSSFLFKNPIEYYNHMHHHWLSIKFESAKKSFVKYENLLSRKVTFITQLQNHFHLEKREQKHLFFPNLHLKPLTKDYSNEDIQGEGNFDLKFYTNNKFMLKYNKDDRMFVLRNVNSSVFKALSYSFSDYI